MTSTCEDDMTPTQAAELLASGLVGSGLRLLEPELYGPKCDVWNCQKPGLAYRRRWYCVQHFPEAA